MNNTPLIKIDNLYLKREDLNPSGSAKDRAMLFQLKKLISQKYNSAAISSTGNAAISAIRYCLLSKIHLNIFISPKINPSKYRIINSLVKKNPILKLITSNTPISDSIKFSRLHRAYLLRQSTDSAAQEGYGQIASEIVTQLPRITSIFIPVGSGSTLCGIAKKLPTGTKIFAVQSAFNPSVCRFFNPTSVLEKKCLTDALTARYTPLKKKIIDLVTKSRGTGLVVSNSEILKASHYLTDHSISTSYEGALALAGFLAANQKNLVTGKYPVILLTGAKR